MTAPSATSATSATSAPSAPSAPSASSGDWMVSRARVAATSAAIRNTAARAAAVVRAGGDISAPVPGLEWDLSQTAVHLAAETSEYAAVLTGELDVEEHLRAAAGAEGPGRRSAALNARQVQRSGPRSRGELADDIEAAAQHFAEAAAARTAQDEVQVTNGLRMTVDTMAKVILGEQLIHGLDLARAAGARWEMAPEDALRVIDGSVTLIPEYVDRVRAQGVDASYELRLRGGPNYRLVFDHGTARVLTSGGLVDCKISADPVAFLLVGYGRASQWSQILRGRMVAHGLKPWLGLQFGRLLTSI